MVIFAGHITYNLILVRYRKTGICAIFLRPSRDKMKFKLHIGRTIKLLERM